MSFRMFVYYCAVVGAWSGWVGWALGRLAVAGMARSPEQYPAYILRESTIALLLGFAIAFGLSFLDAGFNHSLRRIGTVFLCVCAAVSLGICGGLCGGFLGGTAFFYLQYAAVFLLSWTIVGFLVGMSISFYQVVASLITGKDLGSAVKKLIKCVVGGTIGGILGGGIALVLGKIAEYFQRDLWTPTALGFIAIGACIGLLVGLAQIILKEAWIRVEAGFRPGREMLLQKEKTTIGRAEGSDIALFGDSGVEKAHANIIKEAGRYYLEDLQTPGGTYINDQKVEGKAALKAGDLIRMGKSVLRFNERTKRKD